MPHPHGVQLRSNLSVSKLSPYCFLCLNSMSASCRYMILMISQEKEILQAYIWLMWLACTKLLLHELHTHALNFCFLLFRGLQTSSPKMPDLDGHRKLLHSLLLGGACWLSKISDNWSTSNSSIAQTISCALSLFPLYSVVVLLCLESNRTCLHRCSQASSRMFPVFSSHSSSR